MLSCLIVEDEPLAQQVLKQYIEETPELQLTAICNNATKAFEILHTHPIDLLFLDIKMPGISGIEFLKSLKNPPAVIFTTAYAEHAVESYELNAVDYLLKPVTKERFNKSIQKLLKTIPEEKQAEDRYMYVKVKSDLVQVNYAEIMYVEARKDYLQIYTTKQQILTHMTMKTMEELLQPPDFIRIHRSFLVASRFVTSVSKKQVVVNDTLLPVGESYKKKILLPK